MNEIAAILRDTFRLWWHRGPGLTATVINQVIERDRMHCCHCGIPLEGLQGSDWALRERRNRPRWIRPQADTYTAGNLVTLCGRNQNNCRRQVASRVGSDSYQDGYRAHWRTPDITDVPIQRRLQTSHIDPDTGELAAYRDGNPLISEGWTYFTRDGGTSEQPPSVRWVVRLTHHVPACEDLVQAQQAAGRVEYVPVASYDDAYALASDLTRARTAAPEYKAVAPERSPYTPDVHDAMVAELTETLASRTLEVAR